MTRFWIFLGALSLNSCIAVRTLPSLETTRTARAERYAQGTTLTSWTELLPRTFPPEPYLHLFTLGVYPSRNEDRRVHHLRVERPNSPAESGRIEVAHQSIRSWFAWCWWFSKDWKMGSLFHQHTDLERKIETTLLNRLAEPSRTEVSP